MKNLAWGANTSVAFEVPFNVSELLVTSIRLGSLLRLLRHSLEFRSSISPAV